LTFDVVRCMNSIIWWDMSKILYVTSLVTSPIYGNFCNKEAIQGSNPIRSTSNSAIKRGSFYWQGLVTSPNVGVHGVKFQPLGL
jgi:hypothetical protein